MASKKTKRVIQNLMDDYEISDLDQSVLWKLPVSKEILYKIIQDLDRKTNQNETDLNDLPPNGATKED